MIEGQKDLKRREIRAIFISPRMTRSLGKKVPPGRQSGYNGLMTSFARRSLNKHR
jgi:hypothetical protein